MVIYKSEQSLTEADLDMLEYRLGIKFPSRFRSWLLRYNGGIPIPRKFRFKNERGAYTDSLIAWFYSSDRLDETFRVYKVIKRRILDNLVPIADDPFGNQILLSVSGDDEGKVYFWDHEEEPVPPSYSNCHLIADSFDEFIEGLHD